MGKVVSIINQKGGVGKTTSAINIAASLAVAERQALLLDFDPQGNATSGLGISVDQVQGKTVYQALVGQCRLEEAIRETELPGLWVVPADQNLSGAEVELVGAIAREQKLKKALEPIRERFDYILIDCPPSLGLLTINALTASDSYLVPMQCEYFSLEGLSQLVSTAGLIQGALNPKLELEGILLTMFDSRNNLAHQVQEEVKRHFGNKLFGSVIPRNVKLSEAPSHGKPVLLYDIESKGAKAYLEMTKEMIARNMQPLAESVDHSAVVAAAAAVETPVVVVATPEPVATVVPTTDSTAVLSAAEALVVETPMTDEELEALTAPESVVPAPAVASNEAAVGSVIDAKEPEASALDAAEVVVQAPDLSSLAAAELTTEAQGQSADALEADSVAADVNALAERIAEISADEVAAAGVDGLDDLGELAVVPPQSPGIEVVADNQIN